MPGGNFTCFIRILLYCTYRYVTCQWPVSALSYNIYFTLDTPSYMGLGLFWAVVYI